MDEIYIQDRSTGYLLLENPEMTKIPNVITQKMSPNYGSRWYQRDGTWKHQTEVLGTSDPLALTSGLAFHKPNSRSNIFGSISFIFSTMFQHCK